MCRNGGLLKTANPKATAFKAAVAENRSAIRFPFLYFKYNKIFISHKPDKTHLITQPRKYIHQIRTP